MDSFKPCPFCGGNVEIVSDGNIYDGRKWCEMEYAECQKCYMRSPSIEVDEDNKKYFLELWNSRPTVDNSHIQTILSNSKRCLEIFFGERSDEECLQCPYRDKGVNCVFSLIEEQNKILRLQDFAEEQEMKEAYECINHLFSDRIFDGNHKAHSAKEKALSAISKQIPQKPINVRREIVCPTCKTLVGSSPYCRYCGQMLDYTKGE